MLGKELQNRKKTLSQKCCTQWWGLRRITTLKRIFAIFVSVLGSNEKSNAQDFLRNTLQSLCLSLSVAAGFIFFSFHLRLQLVFPSFVYGYDIRKKRTEENWWKWLVETIKNNSVSIRLACFTCRFNVPCRYSCSNVGACICGSARNSSTF